MKQVCLPCDASFRDYSSDESYVEKKEAFDMESVIQEIEILESQLEQLEDSVNNHKKLVRHEPVWQIELKDGQLRLQSEIKTLEELFLFGKAAIRYLSPFGHAFQTCFISKDSIPSYTRKAIETIARAQLDRHLIAASPQHDQCWNPSKSLIQPIQTRTMVAQLVDKYFACLNVMIPILHEPSFREHYNSLQDPLEDIITLAICTASSISTCRHSFLNTHERRYMGEYFYHLSIEKLVEIFDEPDRRLETLITINLLQEFMIITLRVKELQKWNAIGLLITAIHLDRAKRIKSATMDRNIFVINAANFNLKFFLGFEQIAIPPFDISFDVLPDEPKKTQMLFDIANRIMKLVSYKPVVHVITQTQWMAAGHKGELNFEDILQYEQIFKTWWCDLPDHLKLCNDMYAITDDLVQSTTETPKLLIALLITTQVLSINSYVIQLVSTKRDQEIYRLLKEKTICTVMYLSDTFLSLHRQVNQLECYCYSSNSLLLRTIDSLVTLSQVKELNENTANQIKAKIRFCMKDLTMHVLPDHQVTPTNSPYSIIAIAPSDKLPSPTELYKHYPLPFEALSFDIVQVASSKVT
ncbi:hypothetical protein CU098_007613 [Rhizopus stolonifer]|uniref:Xylanolytic transcriptional activator regulatory domain-containing protein n=1 Tax=Rhizopus stolonifer TaxID=4846 RepID=A0A367KSR2_RHIST|nr:hypothetical protein CU098_007613 [Rhizopus stolonifer]